MIDADTRTVALAWHDAGTCVLPAATDGTKRPAFDWKSYQQQRPTREQVNQWFADGPAGLGVVCGQVSGNLEMVELEGRAVTAGALNRIAEAVAAGNLTDLWERVTLAGYAEHTPSGGLHLLYRVADQPVPGNTKLARNATGEVLAETRGEGGWVVIAPSHGTTHPTGQPWTCLYGNATTVPTITADERQAIHAIIRSLDETPPPVEPTPAQPRLRAVDGGLAPGDDFEQRVDWADAELLGGAGWRPMFTHGGRRYWQRPGKDGRGISATTGGAADGRDRLYVFTTSTDFESEKPYTKFGAYALLHHGGDYSAAAKTLRAAGYGRPAPLSPDPGAAQREAIAEIAPAAAERPRLAVVDGTSARVIEPAPKPHAYGPTQDGLARAFVDSYGSKLRYCPQRAKWLTWSGHRWVWDDAEYHRELVLTLARELPDDDGWRRFKSSALSAAGVTGIARLAQTNPTVTVALSALDADPWSLNTPDGIVDLRTGQLAPSDPAKLCTRSTFCAPDTTADPGRWHEFLADTFGDDHDLIAYLQRLVGYSAVGIVGPHVLPFAHGSGGNGKGVFLEALAAVLGDYATSAPNGFLMAQHYAGHETEIARLAGARMVICSEVNEDDRFDEAKVKMLTGGDTLTARFMRQDHFTFTPTHQLWLMGNDQPTVRSGGRSFWRRLRLIPFLHEVPEDKMVDDLQGILKRDHGPALLSWIAAGAAIYHSAGLQEPDSVKSATAEYAHDQDSVAKFVEQCCHLGGGEHVTIRVSKVREAYETWCYAEGVKPVSAKRLGMDLERRFKVMRPRTNSARLYANITLLADENASPDESPDASLDRSDRGGW